MKKMSGQQLRKAYLEFFADKGHQVMPSAPLVPDDDPSLLFINAGMAPFKPYFSGEETPPYNRVTTSQKCIRTNDIENVGKTKRHQTFFEMLGNFSFGDYFKEEAITWAWEFVTEVLELEKDRLWITIYHEDDRSFEIWNKKIGIPRDKIIRMGKEENFWQIGTGPCGPCSEIHFDRKPNKDNKNVDIVAEEDRFLEIWNLVFSQYNYTKEGEYLPLPEKNIDTGMGLERVASILQGVDSNFETDLLWPIIEYVQGDSGLQYDKSKEIKTAYRVIADHVRTVSLAISDGALPSNEGRGYVIRRLLRRAVRYGQKLGYKEPFLYQIVPVVEDIMGTVDEDLADKREHIQQIIESEEERFLKTLDQGMEILEDMLKEMRGKNKQILSGKEAFKLYDTYGFPLDLTRDILEEKGFEVDKKGFAQEMEKQRERARKARQDIGFGNRETEIYKNIKERIGSTEFTGYRSLSHKTKIVALVQEGEEVKELNEGENGEVILEYTPFYSESGGQVADHGQIKGENKNAVVQDVQHKMELIIHQVKVEKGKFEPGEEVEAQVTEEKRKAVARNHSATHLLHKALKEVLGEHVNQSGSLVAPERLRFDFSHYSALEEGEIKQIEEIVNKNILANLPVETLETTIDKAKDMGATALFNEKYGKQVRVVKMGEYSIELCGGTHVEFTGEIGLFKIVDESSIAAGIRRIEAVTGINTLTHMWNRDKLLGDISSKLRTNFDQIPGKLEALLKAQKELEKEITSLKDKLADSKSSTLLNQMESVNGVNMLITEVEDLDNEGLRNLADELQAEMESGIVILSSRKKEKVIFVCSVSEDLVEEGYHAGDIIGDVAQITGGGGGGRSDLAQAGGSKPDKLSEALKEARNIITTNK